MTFLSMFDRHEPEVLDHTAIITAKTCFRKYFLKIVLGFRPNDKPHFIEFGSCYHTFREVLERKYQELGGETGVKFDSAKAEQALDAATTVAGAQWMKSGGDPPVGVDFDYLTGERLLKSCLVAYEWWKKEKISGRIQVIAIEQEFVVLLADDKTKTGGRADQIVEWNSKLWGRDFKSTSKNAAWFNRMLEPNDQITRYTMAEGKLWGQPVQGQLVELLYNTKKEGPKIIPLIATRTPEQLIAWEREQVFFSHLLDEMRELDCYPMCESHCPYCEFHSVCKQATEASMSDVLRQHFSQKKWDFTRSQETI